jgi:hypothetical protein
MAEVIAELNATADETIRIPRNAMRLLRQSYDSQEKVKDWLLAIAVVGAMVFVFRNQLMGLLPNAGPNVGRHDNYVPNQKVGDAFPNTEVQPRIYTYNMPPSRSVRHDRGPSATRPPSNPSCPPGFPDDTY